MSQKSVVYGFVLIFIIIFIVLPIIFPHNQILYWVRNILFIALLMGLLYDFIRYIKRKKS
ncbi:hypothetical protein ABNB59_07250 [Paenibacillus larvae]|uniref:Uncharacterized protein n=2 Tax=Paenibacillus larvae TaxID=1464 RepID=A0A2L1U9G4_9BACL|nr:hypothetical protein [Paenibacillus larvae]AQT85444.1 hypothetical protein B1222_15200 [Paenibacillus larvae subsp. pulvifaciens]AQR79099.1 hypothetical protein BXP28_19575 [Paenibacillus larvae subsp. larvae]AQZ47449.1 hypothetical protein B5S25_13545 [Paenibacillus larvae subsp. pulvifaciens]ARF68760.1 hypothetical protein B7C51_14600 [Paenibacillus larvae subsp. pulvifaciens]AVF23785.1 hypothetical protein ERICI_04056 [Paenibacillus larvae subsp. larvae]